ncbi:hypothetical protein [Betafusellovirus yellowstonense]|uniref:Uncharacterized protein n=1 Tax=Betafusellovirus yellowstonense TaxID=693629 RepID=D1GFB7_9VIRU|nr:hypothetical protein SSSV1_gp33 [Acidianus spindle-shaped virus 1]ACZ35818.1 hypothetical protein [Acidianus spindle-shaped virus 1]
MDNRICISTNFHGFGVEVYGACGFGSFRCNCDLSSKFLRFDTLLHHLHLRFHSCGNWC